MILPLRQSHRLLFAGLSVLLPIAFAVGIAARKPVPRIKALPAGLAGPAETLGTTIWERSDLFAKAPVSVRLFRSGAGAFAISLAAKDDFVKPDLIVYWVAGNPTLGDELPENAVLLGSFGSSALPFPEEMVTASGVLVLYSLADAEFVDVSKPTRINDSTQ